MSWSLAVLLLATLAIVAGLTSAAMALALPWLDRATARLSPRHRARAWLWLAALPMGVGILTVVATLLPAIGFGVDHCPAHDLHHPHLCPHHVAEAPGWALVAITLVFAARGAQLLASLGSALILSLRVTRGLAQVSERRGDVSVFDADEPRAFVLGVLTPRIHVSSGLLRLGRRIVEPVLAHERAHVAARDLLWRALCPLMAAAHLPPVARQIARRLAVAQEMAADAAAAHRAKSPVQVAEALIALARMHSGPPLGLSFMHGDVAPRVRALLATDHRPRPWPVQALAVAAVATVVAGAALNEPLHHALETLLGALG